MNKVKTICEERLDDFHNMIKAEFDFHFNYDDSACYLPTECIVSGKCHNVSAVYNERCLQNGREVVSVAGFLVGIVEE